MPSVRTPGFHCYGPGSTPGQGTEILTVVQHSQKQTDKKTRNPTHDSWLSHTFFHYYLLFPLLYFLSTELHSLVIISKPKSLLFKEKLRVKLKWFGNYIRKELYHHKHCYFSWLEMKRMTLWNPMLCWLCLVISWVQLFATLWSVARQDPLSMGILQARTLEWVAMPSSRGSSQHRDQTQISSIAGGFSTMWATREAQEY